MRKARKIIAAMMVLVLTLAMSVTVFAEQWEATYKITVEDTEKGHKYEAYQIFTGELSEDGKKLSNIQWGMGISEEGKKALGDASEFAKKLEEGVISAEEAAAIIGTYLTTQTACVTRYEDKGGTYNYVLKNLPAGYYLVKDADCGPDKTGLDHTAYILQVVNDVVTKPKRAVSSVEKFVKDTNDSTGEVSDWQKTADYDEGDTVPFRLAASLPSNINAYKTYKLVFHDTLSAGLTYAENDDFTVKIGDAVVDGFTKTVAQNEDGTTSITFTCDDIKALGQDVTAETTVAIEYNAVLNGKAITGVQGNANEVYLEFSNNPNKSGEGNGETDKTPADKAVVFTYKVVVNKVDQDNNPLAGAEFTLSKLVNGEKVAVASAVVSAEGTNFEFLRLDDGEYVLEETQTPDGYNSIPEVTFTITADHNDTALSLDALRADQTSEGTTLVRFAENLPEGALATDVMNASGATLPSTGGAGTVIIYTVGIILVLGAAIFLITRRRVSKK